MECSDAHRLIHEYLDQDLDGLQEVKLKEHLSTCTSCRSWFQQLQQTIALVQSASHIYAPADFTEKVLARLPRERFFQRLKIQMQQHPFLAAASLFLLLMTGSIFSLWFEEDRNFQLIAEHPEKLEMDRQHNMVIVPANSVVSGDILIRNADISVEGKVEGNVIVVDGRIYLASTGSISGEKREIHEAVEWVWYQIKKAANKLVP